MSDTGHGPPDTPPHANGGRRNVLFHLEVDYILESLSNYHRREVLFLLKEGEIDTLDDRRTFFRLGFPRSLRSLREPLGAKIYAKKAASADSVRSGSEPLASLADASSDV